MIRQTTLKPIATTGFGDLLRSPLLALWAAAALLVPVAMLVVAATLPLDIVLLSALPVVLSALSFVVVAARAP